MNVRVIEVDRKAIFEAHLLIDEDSIFLYMVVISEVASVLNMNSTGVELFDKFCFIRGLFVLALL